MRNLKKVLTLVLTLAMLLSVMVVGAGAATFNDQDSIKNAQAVDVCTTLSIIDGIDGSFKPNENVTRAQMCKMICVALNGGNTANMGSNVGNTFTDVAAGYWGTPFIEYCVREKVVAGVGGGSFDPEGSVTGSQAAKMLLVILGYDPAIQGYVGSNSWELNINSDAAKKGLYAGIETIDPSAPLSRDNAAQMIWNALQANEVWYTNSMILGPNGTMVPVVQDKVVGTTSDKISLLSDKYDANIAVGTFAGNGVNRSDLNSGECLITKGLINGRTVYDTTGGNTKVINEFSFKSDFDLKYIGEEIMVLYKDGLTGTRGQLDPKDNVFGVFLTGASTVYNIAKADLQDAPDNKDKIKFGDKEYNANPLSSGGIDVYKNYTQVNENNSDIDATDFDTSVDDNYAETCADTIKFIEENGKIVAAYITEYSVGRVTSTTSDEIAITGISNSLRFVDNEIDDGLQRDDIVFFSKVYDSETYIVEKATPVTGTLDSYNVPKGTVTVSGTTYDADVRDDSEISNADHFNTLNGMDEFKILIDGTSDLTSNDLDKNVEAYVMNGCVLALRVIDSTKNYALVDAISGNGTNISPYYVYLILADGTSDSYRLSTDSVLKGDQINSVINKSVSVPDKVNTGTQTFNSKLLVTYTFTNGDQVKLNYANQVINSSNSGEKVNKDDWADHYGTLADIDSLTEAWYNSSNKTLYRDTSNTVGIVDSDCVLFVHTGKKETNSSGTNQTEQYRVYNNVRNLDTINKLAADGRYGLYGLNDKNGNVSVAYIDLGNKPSGANATTMYGIVTSVGDVKSAGNNNFSVEYSVYANNEPATITIEGDDQQTLPSKGDLIYFEKNENNVYGLDEIVIVAENPDDGNSDTFTLKNPPVKLNNATPVSGISATAVQIEKYDGKLLTYATNAELHLDGKNAILWADTNKVGDEVASDVMIVFVNAAGNKAGSTCDYGAVVTEDSGGTAHVYKNAIILKDTDTNKIVAMYLDSGVERNIER